MPGLRDILDAATSEGMRIGEVADRIEANVWLEDHAPELAALALDMGEELRAMRNHRDIDWNEVDSLLARLDQLGKEQTDA